MSFTSEFREFAVKGNVMDLAVGVMIGAAFQKIVNSLVNDILMPPIGYLTGGVDFSYLAINLETLAYGKAALTSQPGEPVLRFGMFINEAINFFILAGVLFFIVRTMNRVRRKQEKTETKEAAKAAAAPAKK